MNIPSSYYGQLEEKRLDVLGDKSEALMDEAFMKLSPSSSITAMVAAIGTASESHCRGAGVAPLGTSSGTSSPTATVAA